MEFSKKNINEPGRPPSAFRVPAQNRMMEKKPTGKTLQTTKKTAQTVQNRNTPKAKQTAQKRHPSAARPQNTAADRPGTRKIQSEKKRRSKKRPKASKIEIFLTVGISIMVIAIAISLFSYFHPFTWSDIKNFASSRIEAIKQGKLDQSGQLPDLSATEESPSYMNYTTDMGNISDFTAEPVFPEQDDSIYSFIMDTSLGPMLYYNQGDLRWKSYLYGGTDPLSKYGCGPVCVAMIINSFGSASVSPVETAEWSAENGCFARSGGSYHNLIPDSLSAFGLHVESVSDRTAETAAGLLRSGHLLVALMGKGSLTNNGHFIIITQLTPSGNVYIADPASYENSTKEWDLQQLMDELKQSYDSGGPLWVVSLSE